MIENIGILKHSEHARDGGDIPIHDRLIEFLCTPEHVSHVCNVADIPSADVVVKGDLVLEGVGHIRNPGYVPILDVSVGGDGCGLVGTPQVDRGLKVGVGKSCRSRHVGRPVVVPIGIERLTVSLISFVSFLKKDLRRVKFGS